MTCDEVAAKLELYADSELAAPELAAAESHLRSCASCAARALALMQTKRAIRVAASARFTPSPEFRRCMEQNIASAAASQHLAPSPSSPAFPSRAWFSFSLPRLAVAAVAVVLLVAAALWVNHSARENQLTEIADLHVAALASANPVDVVSTDKHTVKPWFAGKLPFSFNLPEMQNSPFVLVGGRVAYFQHSSGAQLLFNLRKHQLSVFIFKEEGLPFSVGTFAATRLSMHTESWSQGGLRYFIVSDAPAADVHALGELMRQAARS